MLVTAGKKVLSAMQVVMLLAPGVLTTPRKRQCCSGKRNFFDFVPFPGAFQAKGGMSNDAVGNSGTAHFHAWHAEPDCGCGQPDS